MAPGLRRAALAAVIIAGPGSIAWADGTALDGAALFKQQCSACHRLDPNAPPGQGPNLAGVYGRKAGSVPGFSYSPGFAKADFNWDEQHLDPYLTNPQSVIAGAVMPYRQAKAPVRAAIIGYLKEQSK